jgi:hypothetical protein
MKHEGNGPDIGWRRQRPGLRVEPRLVLDQFKIHPRHPSPAPDDRPPWHVNHAHHDLLESGRLARDLKKLDECQETADQRTFIGFRDAGRLREGTRTLDDVGRKWLRRDFQTSRGQARVLGFSLLCPFRHRRRSIQPKRQEIGGDARSCPLHRWGG